jgi:hypothetical protein
MCTILSMSHYFYYSCHAYYNSHCLAPWCLQSLLAALGSVQFVSNVFFAYLMLNEVVTKRYATSTSMLTYMLV